MAIAPGHGSHSTVTSETPRLQPFLHLVRVEALGKPSAHRSLARSPAASRGLVVQWRNHSTYLYFYVTRDGIYLDVVFWELQLLGNLVPQGPSIPHDLLDHGLFLRPSGPGVIVDRKVF